MAKQFVYSPIAVQICFRSSAGYPMGTLTTPDSPTPGVGGVNYHSYVLKNIVSFEGTQPSRAIAVDLGGSKIRAQADVGVESFGTGTLVLSERDDIFESYITGSSVDSSTVSGWRDSGSNVNNIISPSFFLIVTTKADVIDDTVSPPTVTKRYLHYIFPNCQITKANTGSVATGGGTNTNAFSYTIIPSISYRALSGLPFSGTGMALSDNSDLCYVSQTANPIAVTTFVEGSTPDGAWVTGYRPLTTHATTSDKKFTTNGASDSLTGLSVTTGVAGATPTSANDIRVLLYETAFVAI
jgi:hypothetical protein